MREFHAPPPSFSFLPFPLRHYTQRVMLSLGEDQHHHQQQQCGGVSDVDFCVNDNEGGEGGGGPE